MTYKRVPSNVKLTDYVLQDVDCKFLPSKPSVYKKKKQRKNQQQHVVFKMPNNDNEFRIKRIANENIEFIDAQKNRLDDMITGAVVNLIQVKNLTELQKWLNFVILRTTNVVAMMLIVDTKWFCEMLQILKKSKFVFCDQMLLVGKINDTLCTCIESDTDLGYSSYLFRKIDQSWNATSKQRFSNMVVFDITDKRDYYQRLFEEAAKIIDYIARRNMGKDTLCVYFDSNAKALTWKKPIDWNFYLLD